jgi:hypothetical protein
MGDDKTRNLLLETKINTSAKPERSLLNNINLKLFFDIASKIVIRKKPPIKATQAPRLCVVIKLENKSMITKYKYLDLPFCLTK